MSAGIDWDAKRGRCPACGRDGETGFRGTLGITPKDNGNAIARCFRCDFMTWRDADEPAAPRPVKPVTRQTVQHERLSDYGHELLHQLRRPIEGEARAYLLARHCALPPDDGDLFCHPAWLHKPSGTRGPAIVGLVTDAVTGEPLTLHQTWVQADGHKAAVIPPRMLLGGHRKAGGVIRLWPDECVTAGLAIAEGVETALSVAHAYKPVWSCIDAGNLAALPVLGGIECLTIAADHDDAGIKAAESCAARWAAAGVDVAVIAPAQARTDWNDARAVA